MREPLDLLVADSETEASWVELFKSLKRRGVSALKQNFQGVQWKRCQTHFMRNILGRAPRHLHKAMASQLKLVFQAERKSTALPLAQRAD